MEKLKLLHLYKSFNVFNGLIEILTIMAHDLDQSRYELGVCVNEYEKNSFGEKFQELGGKIYSLESGRGLGGELRAFVRLVRFLKRHRPHVIQTHALKANLLGSLAANMSRVPVVIATEMTLKDTAPSKARRARDRLLQPLATSLINRCDKYVVTSDFIKKEWSPGVDEERFEVIYPPFNLQKYQLATRTPRTTSPGEPKNIGFVGRLSDEKAVPILIAAFQQVKDRLKNSVLTLVGTGPLERQLKDSCVSLGLEKQIRFAGYAPNSFEAMKQFDVFILPSRTEGCPIVVLEAMAMALPVVATRVGGTPELVVDGKTALLVPPNDPSSMAQAILKILTTDGLAKEMGELGRKRAFEDFHPSLFTRRLQELYQQLHQDKAAQNALSSRNVRLNDLQTPTR